MNWKSLSPFLDNHKIRGILTYATIKGDAFDFKGYGINGVSRQAMSNEFAMDVSVGMFILDGSIDLAGLGSMDMTMMSIPFSVNGEYQAIKTPAASLIFFAGPTMSISTGSIDSSYTILGTTYSDTITTTTTLFGVQGGGQVSGRLGDFKVSPFAMIQSQSGSSTSESSYGSSTTTDIPSYTTTSFGVDVLYVPWNMTLSSVLQQAAKSGDNEEVKTNIFQMSFNF